MQGHIHIMILMLFAATGCTLEAITEPSLVLSPCESGAATVGERCPDGSIYAGTFDGGRYVVMPEACDGSTKNPQCVVGGVDSVKLTWNDGTTNFEEPPGIEIIDESAGTTKSSSLFRGDVNTAALGLLLVPTSGGVYEAAKYCEDLELGGHRDWYCSVRAGVTQSREENLSQRLC